MLVTSVSWFKAERAPREYAAFLLSMQTDKATKRKWFEENVPDHFKDLVWDHVLTAHQLGGNHDGANRRSE